MLRVTASVYDLLIILNDVEKGQILIYQHLLLRMNAIYQKIYDLFTYKIMFLLTNSMNN